MLCDKFVYDTKSNEVRLNFTWSRSKLFITKFNLNPHSGSGAETWKNILPIKH